MTHKRNIEIINNFLLSSKRNKTLEYKSDSSDYHSDSTTDSSDEDIEEITCSGRNCDHREDSKNVPPIPENLENCDADYQPVLGDLIKLALAYHCKMQQQFKGISLEKLSDMLPALEKLENSIGMRKIKETFTNQIIYFLLDSSPNHLELLHTVLCGSPGIGKTYMIDILAEIYLSLGYLEKKIVHKVKITDLKGKYVGYSSAMTQAAINKAIGGILVIDEVYSIGGRDRDIDSFSKDIINTLNQNLTEKAGKFICIICGYEDDIEKCFFSANQGLKSRFRFKFVLDPYTAEELLQIFSLKLTNDNWKYHLEFRREDRREFFIRHLKYFQYYGRDMENLLYHVKLSQINRIFLRDHMEKNTIVLEDMNSGMEKFKIHHKKEDTIPKEIEHLYM